MGIRVSETDVRYPDASVHCGARPEHGNSVKALDAPVIIIEVLSPSTATYDQGKKLDEYRSLPSLELIAFVDPVNELVRSVRRLVSARWFDSLFSAGDLELTPLNLTIPHTDIFASD